MAVKLNRRAVEHAKRLIERHRVVLDDRDAWSQHQPSSRKENAYIQEHGIMEYGRWFLGVDEEEPADTKGHYKFPYGDFENVHRCALLAAQSRAGQYKYVDVQRAAAELHGMLDTLTV